MIRQATMADSSAILELVNSYADQGLMLKKCPYDIYRYIQSFLVAEEKGCIIGCVRLAIAWKDLAEVASLAVHPEHLKKGVGRQLVKAALEQAKDLKISKVFTLTYQCDFFKKCGFNEVERDSLPHKVFGDCLNCAKVDCCDEHAFIKVLDSPKKKETENGK